MQVLEERVAARSVEVVRGVRARRERLVGGVAMFSLRSFNGPAAAHPGAQPLAAAASGTPGAIMATCRGAAAGSRAARTHRAAANRQVPADDLSCHEPCQAEAAANHGCQSAVGRHCASWADDVRSGAGRCFPVRLQVKQWIV
jgi:hypothetical protein